MSKKSKVRIQMSSDIIKADEKIFRENGFTNQEIIDLLFKQVLINSKLPFPLKISSNG